MRSAVINRPIAAVKRSVEALLRRLGYALHRIRFADDIYELAIPFATYAPWNKDRRFLDAYRAIQRHTYIDKYRCYELWALVEQSRKIEGDLIEVGVWRGGSGALIAERARQCEISATVYLCDTFTGVVKTSAHDSRYKGGEHADTSRQIVEQLVFERLNLDNVEILEGIFPDQTAARIAERRFRFCHIDVDAYQSAKDSVEWIWDKLAVGGIVVYDDYGFDGCDGITKHVEEQRPSTDRLVIHNLNGHAVIIKIG